MKKELITHLKKDARRRKAAYDRVDFDTWGDRLIIAVLILAIIALIQTLVISW